MTQDPINDVASHLETLGLGLPVYRGPVVAMSGEVPSAAIFVMAGGGSPPAPFIGRAASTWEVEVEVTVRGAPEAKDAPRQVARTINHALQTADVSGYFSVRAEDSEPEYIRKDDAGCHEWAVAFTLGWTG